MTKGAFSSRTHWDDVYNKKVFSEVSWYQEVPGISLKQILTTGVTPTDPIIDVGGGASTLVDHLLERGFRDISVVDISSAALEQAQSRLGARAGDVDWVVADVTAFVAERRFVVWHDRAVLHFLTDATDRQKYVESLRRALVPGGHLVLSTFGPDGPPKCSGLQVRRYTVAMMEELLGPEFELTDHVLADHRTPWGAAQQFLHSSWTRTAG